MRYSRMRGYDPLVFIRGLHVESLVFIRGLHVESLVFIRGLHVESTAVGRALGRGHVIRNGSERRQRRVKRYSRKGEFKLKTDVTKIP